VLSERTVESHISRILVKTGLTAHGAHPLVSPAVRNAIIVCRAKRSMAG